MRSVPRALLAACAALAVTTPSAQAVVGGSNASPGEYPSVARVVLGNAFACTGTLVAPQWVVTAGHCGSITGATGVSSPAAWPAPAVTVTVGETRRNDGTGDKPAVERVVVSPSYLGLFENRHDVALLKLARPSTKTPTPIVAVAERDLWEPGDLQTIAGWGVTKEGGSTPTTLQEAQVPVTSDEYAADAYDDYDPATMVPAGYPQGGIDTCQGDSGGPLFAKVADGTFRVTGATSYGEGCARPGKPGIYAAVAGTAIRGWIDQVAPEATADSAATGGTSSAPAKGGKGTSAKGGKKVRAAR